jgi:hypothetical protein
MLEGEYILTREEVGFVAEQKTAYSGRPNFRHPAEMAEAEIKGFLTHIAVEEKVNEILLRDGKGAKNRIMMLPESLKASLQEHFKKVKLIHITCRNKWPDGAASRSRESIFDSLARNREMSYTDNIQDYCILRGPI